MKQRPCRICEKPKWTRVKPDHLFICKPCRKRMVPSSGRLRTRVVPTPQLSSKSLLARDYVK
jgi:hypothetical protein